MRRALIRRRRQTGVAAAAPINTAAPAVSGTALIGQELTSSSGTWSGTGAITYAYQWRRDGVDIAGATANTYTLVAADDEAAIACRVTATDDNGSRSAITGTVVPTYASPVAAGGLSDRTYTQGTGNQTVDASADFTGAVGGSWSVAGTGASIDSAGLVTITTDDLRAGSIVTVTYTNSGGTDSTAFQVTVQEEAADAVTFDSTATRFDSTLITFDRSA